MRGSGRWGQVLNVEEPYLWRSQAFILALFSGVHGNGSSDGRGGGGGLTLWARACRAVQCRQCIAAVIERGCGVDWRCPPWRMLVMFMRAVPTWEAICQEAQVKEGLI